MTINIELLEWLESALAQHEGRPELEVARIGAWRGKTWVFATDAIVAHVLCVSDDNLPYPDDATLDIRRCIAEVKLKRDYKVDIDGMKASVGDYEFDPFGTGKIKWREMMDRQLKDVKPVAGVVCINASLLQRAALNERVQLHQGESCFVVTACLNEFPFDRWFALVNPMTSSEIGLSDVIPQ